MIRFISVVTVVGLLAGLIAYSQFRPQPNRVSGFVEADEIRVGSRIGGRVHAVLVSEGQRVEVGQPLIKLEPFDLLQREQKALHTLASLDAAYQRLAAGLRAEEVAQAKAHYEQFHARHELLVAGPRKQEIEAARSRVLIAEAEHTLAQQRYKRSENLLKTEAVTRSEFDAATEKLAGAAAMVVVRKEELALLEVGTREEEKREAQARAEEAWQAWQLAKKGYRSEQVAQAKAARDAARSELDVILEQKKELTIVSPVNGFIEALDLQKGDLVTAGAPVLSVMDDSRLWVRAYVPQNRVGLRVGQTLRVTTDGLSDSSSDGLSGELTFIARQAEFTPSNVQTPRERSKQVFRVKVSLPGGLQKLRPGMTVDVWLDPLGDPE